MLPAILLEHMRSDTSVLQDLKQWLSNPSNKTHLGKKLIKGLLLDVTLEQSKKFRE